MGPDTTEKFTLLIILILFFCTSIWDSLVNLLYCLWRNRVFIVKILVRVRIDHKCLTEQYLEVYTYLPQYSSITVILDTFCPVSTRNGKCPTCNTGARTDQKMVDVNQWMSKSFTRQIPGHYLVAHSPRKGVCTPWKWQWVPGDRPWHTSYGSRLHYFYSLESWSPRSDDSPEVLLVSRLCKSPSVTYESSVTTHDLCRVTRELRVVESLILTPP